jgi:hypothetical protein
MKRIGLFLLVGLIALLTAACGATGNTNNSSTDAEAAQNLQPNIAGYNVTTVDTVTDALAKLGVGAGVLTGDGALVALVTRAESTLQCFQDKGAIDAKAYSEANAASLSLPESGLSIVINNSRLTQEALGCLTGSGSTQRPMAQAIQPCVATGQFTYRSNSYTYVYVGLGDQLCGYFQQHFENLTRGS